MIKNGSNDKKSPRYPQEPLKLTISQVQAQVPVTILRLADRINMGNTEQLVDKAKEVFANGARYLLIDLTNVPSMTSAGLRAIQIIYKLFEAEAPSVSVEKTGKNGREPSGRKELICSGDGN